MQTQIKTKAPLLVRGLAALATPTSELGIALQKLRDALADAPE